MVVCSIIISRQLNHVHNYKVYDKYLFAYMVMLIVGILLINLTRPQNFVVHIIIVDMIILAFYLVIPTRFIYQAVASLIFSLGEVFIITMTFENYSDPALSTALLSLIFANAIAALTSLEMHSYRFRMYQMTNERKETDRLVAIGQTASMIGHDIRNPLQAITSEIYLARQAITESAHPELMMPAKESIDIIEEQTDYISKIVADLQDFARPLKPEVKEVDLSKLIASIFKTVKIPSIITLRVDIKGFPKIQTDPTLIRRALTNLVNNAIQAMPDGGTLELLAQKTDLETIIDVRDTGKGIPEEIKPRLFTPLVTTKAKGQGLGLAVVKRIVEALGGSIRFESESGKGTKFTIILPVGGA
jgi:signal transduction histidine kinase